MSPGGVEGHFDLCAFNRKTGLYKLQLAYIKRHENTTQSKNR